MKNKYTIDKLETQLNINQELLQLKTKALLNKAMKERDLQTMKKLYPDPEIHKQLDIFFSMKSNLLDWE